MGTRNLTAVVLDGQYKVAQYGQWDGYPSGQGETINQFIRAHLMSDEGRDKFREAVRACTWIAEDELKALWVEAGANPESNTVSMDIANRFQAAHPELDRDAGAGVLNMVMNGARKLKNSLSFAADSLFCEWAYVVDLDNMVLEVYEGFNKHPVASGERFADMQFDEDRDERYHQVRLVRKYAFVDLDDDTMKQLEKELSKDDE